MRNLANHLALALLAGAALTLAACNTGVTSPAPNFSIPAVAGEYTGILQDNGGTPQAVSTSTLSQHQAVVGGALVLPAGAESVSWTVDSSGAINGSGAMDVGVVKCIYTMTGTYSASMSQITGTYTAVSNCTGQAGTFTLTQQCTDPTASDLRRPLSAPRPC